VRKQYVSSSDPGLNSYRERIQAGTVHIKKPAVRQVRVPRSGLAVDLAPLLPRSGDPDRGSALEIAPAARCTNQRREREHGQEVHTRTDLAYRALVFW
jgi:hypothetical protein